MLRSSRVKSAMVFLLFFKIMIINALSITSKVQIHQNSGGAWELERNGQPMRILGVGGTEHLSLAKDLGANSVRVWDTSQLLLKNPQGKTVLEEIEELGLSFCAGLWVEHQRHGFSYLDSEKVQKQRDRVREAVRKYKDHPQLLVWGLGNEMEISLSPPDAIRVWKELEQLARIVKEEDPNHPVMTVIAGADPRKVKEIQEHYPSLEILGINAYSGAGGTGATLQSQGWKKPFILAEFGTAGHWQVPQTPWGAPVEPTANEKAVQYFSTLESVMENKEGLCLGSYAFLWGHKQETTPTWYGMLLAGGEKLPSVDAVVKVWTGSWPANRSPKIESLEFGGKVIKAKPGTRLQASAKVTDRDKDSLTYEWTVMAESKDVRHGGDAEAVPPKFPQALDKVQGPGCTVVVPPAGAYRLFLVVRDGKGGASTANLPFLSDSGD